jgi:hypothetical protein
LIRSMSRTRRQWVIYITGGVLTVLRRSKVQSICNHPSLRLQLAVSINSER